jgi:hypothetical protein
MRTRELFCYFAVSRSSLTSINKDWSVHSHQGLLRCCGLPVLGAQTVFSTDFNATSKPFYLTNIADNSSLYLAPRVQAIVAAVQSGFPMQAPRIMSPTDVVDTMSDVYLPLYSPTVNVAGGRSVCLPLHTYALAHSDAVPTTQNVHTVYTCVCR